MGMFMLYTLKTELGAGTTGKFSICYLVCFLSVKPEDANEQMLQIG